MYCRISHGKEDSRMPSTQVNAFELKVDEADHENLGVVQEEPARELID